GKRGELVHHRVDGDFEFEDFPFNIDRNLFGQVAVSDGGGHSRDVADLVGQVAGHEIHIIRQVLPSAGQTSNVGLATQFSFGPHFAGHTSHFGSERGELVHHRVDGVFQFQNLAFDIDGNLLGQIAVGHGRGHGSDITNLPSKI